MRNMERMNYTANSSRAQPHSAPVLIIEDEPDIREVLSDLLQHDGYQVRSAETGAEGIAEVAHHPYSAVLLDLGLPDLDGLSVLRAVKSVDPELPVIILTAYVEDDIKADALGQGAFAYLRKPYKQKELRSALAMATRTAAPARMVWQDTWVWPKSDAS